MANNVNANEHTNVTSRVYIRVTASCIARRDIHLLLLWVASGLFGKHPLPPLRIARTTSTNHTVTVSKRLRDIHGAAVWVFVHAVCVRDTFGSGKR